MKDDVIAEIDQLTLPREVPDPSQNLTQFQAGHSQPLPSTPDTVDAIDKSVPRLLTGAGLQSQDKAEISENIISVACGHDKGELSELKGNALTADDLEAEELTTKEIISKHPMNPSSVTRHTCKALKNAGFEPEKWKKSSRDPVEVPGLSGTGLTKYAVVRYESEIKPGGWRYRALKASPGS